MFNVTVYYDENYRNNHNQQYSVNESDIVLQTTMTKEEFENLFFNMFSQDVDYGAFFYTDNDEYSLTLENQYGKTLMATYKEEW